MHIFAFPFKIVINPALTSRRLNVVVRPPPLCPRGGPKWRDNYPKGPDHPVAPNRLESFFRVTDWSQLDGDSFVPLRPTLIYSPSFTRLLILFLLLASGNVHPSLFAQQIPDPFAPEKLGEPQFNAAAARGRSTPPSLGPLSGPCFSGVVGSAHPVQQTHLTKLQPL